MTDPATSLSDAVRLVLQRRGPVAEADLGRLLAAAGIEVGTDLLDEAIRAAGAIRVSGAAGDLVALPIDRGPSPPPESTELPHDNRVRSLVERTAPEVLILIAATLVVLVVILVASLNAGLRVEPTLDYSPPSTAAPSATTTTVG